ncbi:TPA: LPXTG cell wall anchor domain-containing protein [Streptococcus equi subsp. zooepidemicus]|uniref:LPXTG cell wall anchor domain-containing protein n=1 Tax=Streptococcus equi TaxID=1336 RepID=UPI0005B7956E|nr:LPXTG cell wall anchor domain-containing protein [Streptococcus equi]KIS13092.1 Extracellular protein [Streptococcus equi subsp. zooepidemicus SzAM60]MCD3401582.1 LPXTG cell wall anchor domain-containing protein [Streptococcus equi subsp. zooepidemicus]HEL0020204.1 LPXTG cell wall anchor domain-containing protein [Streptococcus equi subsp. zooepidemicus]HEL0022702.1 LPXTG cell wall anchor domain-containing protein [Streptococcus equi subsp. zooepidemicus]HEL0040631.1 LPXTG cell wall anchor 
MNKWTKLITLSSLVAIIASASPLNVFADENTVRVETPIIAPSEPVPDTDVPVPIQPTTSEPTVTPTVPSDGTNAPEVTPTPELTAPTTGETTKPSEDETTKPTELSISEDDKKDASTTKPVIDLETGTATVPTIDGGTTTLKPDVTTPTNNPNVSAQTAIDAGASQVGTTSKVTGQVVANVTPNTPLYTNTGYQIVSTINSQVVIANADGSTSTVSPEEIGAKVNPDMTILVKTSSGEMTTLPSTGEKGLLTMSAGLGLLALIGAYLFKKKIAKTN